MYRIALVCQHGASTSIVVQKMKDYAKKAGIELDVNAYPDSRMSELVDDRDIILLGPQLAFKKDAFCEKYPAFASRICVIPVVDFGMMNGEKIVKDAIAVIDGQK